MEDIIKLHESSLPSYIEDYLNKEKYKNSITLINKRLIECKISYHESAKNYDLYIIDLKNFEIIAINLRRFHY